MAYCTAAQVKADMGIASSTDDTLIGNFITAAQKIIDSHCQRSFEASATATRYYGPEAVQGQLLKLDTDLLTVTTLTNGDGSVISSSDYWLWPRNETPYSEIKLKSTVTWTFDQDEEISVAGTWGYAATAPADIAQACKRLAIWLYRQKDTTVDIDRPLLTNDGVVVMPQRLPNDVMILLSPYRRRTL